ncbi:MAG: hypothetical protein K2O08_06445, partial [Clostridia bacterium]|nr:hypothetical protein [Clostridia bacterium]
FNGYDIAFDDSELKDVLFLPLNETIELMQSNGKGGIGGFSVKQKKIVTINLDDFVAPYKDYFITLLKFIKMRGV